MKVKMQEKAMDRRNYKRISHGLLKFINLILEIWKKKKLF